MPQKTHVDSKMIQKVSRLYKALSDPTRLKIVLFLSSGESNVGQIVDHLSMEQSAVSHQLKILRETHLVKTRREGKAMFYSLDDEHVVDILSQTMKHIQHTSQDE